jgi:transposase
MHHAAIDLHKTFSQVRIVASDHTEDCRVATTRDRLRTVFEGRERLRVLLEASTESEWVAQLLESLGHEVVVADPNYVPMYGERSRRIKTDRRDVAALAAACGRGLYRQAHRRSMAQWERQWHLTVREQLVWTRTRAISLTRTIGRMAGVHLTTGHAETFVRRVEQSELPDTVGQAVAPLLSIITAVSEAIAQEDAYLADVAERDPAVRRLMTLPGVGPVTATAFIAALDDVHRFATPGHVTSYLGLVPREYSSGEQLRRGRIVPSAHPRVQALLVQVAWGVWRSNNPKTAALRTWAHALGQRRGKRVAAIALARRLARILFAMWRDEVEYTDERLQPRPSAA